MASFDLLLDTDLVGSRQVADVQLGLLEGALSVGCVAMELQLEESCATMPSLICLRHSHESVPLSESQQVQTLPLTSYLVLGETFHRNAPLLHFEWRVGGCALFDLE